MNSLVESVRMFFGFVAAVLGLFGGALIVTALLALLARSMMQ